ncbi:PAS domain S-box protein, partial [Clostridium perfringens]|nr:PAS domain S-box protein [Clostridium perfringens]
MKGFNFEEILEACPMDYIYGKLKSRDFSDLLIIRSSIERLNGKLLSEIFNNDLRVNDIFKGKPFRKVEKDIGLDEYINEFINVKLIDKDYVVIWFNKDLLKQYDEIEKKLKKEKEMLDLFIDSLTDYVFFKDIDGKYINCNKAFENKIGLDKKNIIGKTDRELFSGDDYKIEMFCKTDMEIIKSREKRVYGEEWKFANKDNYLEETIKSPYFDENNEIKGIIGLTRDISYKKAIENRLQKNDSMFFEVLNYLDDVVIIKEGLKTIYVNNAFEKLYGLNCKELYKEESMIIKLDRIHPEDRHKFINIDFENFFSEKARIIRADNEIRTVFFRSNSIKDENGKVI